jgi:hypothetical protein
MSFSVLHLGSRQIKSLEAERLVDGSSSGSYLKWLMNFWGLLESHISQLSRRMELSNSQMAHLQT